LSAETIPADDASYDTVVCTFTPCTIPDPVKALREMRRVLKPDGQMLFCEQGLAPDAGVSKWQHRLTPVWKPIAGGCHLNRDVPSRPDGRSTCSSTAMAGMSCSSARRCGLAFRRCHAIAETEHVGAVRRQAGSVRLDGSNA
jgi:SAM-dependent methyltransferase